MQPDKFSSKNASAARSQRAAGFAGQGLLRGRWLLADSTSPPARWGSLVAGAGGAGFLDGLFDRFAGFARAFLNAANQFFLLAFGVLKIGKASCRERV